MKDRDASRHPGPFRIMRVDSEIAGLLVAVGFLVMGFVSMPIATGFVLGAIALGRCKLTDEQGAESFEDVFLPCVGQTPLPQGELVFDTGLTGYRWTRSPDKGINIPVVYMKYHGVLLPQRFYAEAKRDAGCSAS
jgi:hypothetical protein